MRYYWAAASGSSTQPLFDAADSIVFRVKRATTNIPIISIRDIDVSAFGSSITDPAFAATWQDFANDRETISPQLALQWMELCSSSKTMMSTYQFCSVQTEAESLDLQDMAHAIEHDKETFYGWGSCKQRPNLGYRQPDIDHEDDHQYGKAKHIFVWLLDGGADMTALKNLLSSARCGSFDIVVRSGQQLDAMIDTMMKFLGEQGRQAYVSKLLINTVGDTPFTSKYLSHNLITNKSSAELLTGALPLLSNSTTALYHYSASHDDSRFPKIRLLQVLSAASEFGI